MVESDKKDPVFDANLRLYQKFIVISKWFTIAVLFVLLSMFLFLL